MKEAIVFIHGLTGNSRAFKKQLGYFDEDYNTFAYDLIGHGEDKGKPVEFTLERLTGQLEELFEKENIEKGHICTISYGCYPAAIFAARHQEKVASLCFIGGHYNSDSPLSAVLKHYWDHDYGSYQEWLKHYSHDLFPKSNLVDPYAIISTRVYYKYGYDLHEKVLKEAISHRLHYDLRADLMKLHVPVLWIMGDHDQLFKSSIEDLQDVIPHAIYKELPHSGHAASMFRPYAFRRVYENFLVQVKNS